MSQSNSETIDVKAKRQRTDGGGEKQNRHDSEKTDIGLRIGLRDQLNKFLTRLFPSTLTLH